MNAFVYPSRPGDEETGSSVGLTRLREEEEDTASENDDERTALRHGTTPTRGMARKPSAPNTPRDRP